MEEEKKKKRRRKKEEVVKEEISEVFEVEKDGKEKIIETHTVEKTEEKPVSETQIKKENKVFKGIIITMVGFLLIFLVVYFIITSMAKFEVDGVKFKMIKEGELILYQTSIPVFIGEEKTEADYNFYLRTDPRTLEEKVPTQGEVVFRKNLVLDVTTEDLFCEGDWTIAVANTQNLYTLLGFNISVKDKKKKYQPEDEYMFITINKGNRTEIRANNESAYEININNCEVLPAFEKLMLETFVKYQEVN